MTAHADPSAAPGSATDPGAAPRRGRSPALRRARDLAGLAPFALYVLLGLGLPTAAIVWGAFQNPDTGAFTLHNVDVATHGIYLHGFLITAELALITSVRARHRRAADRLRDLHRPPRLGAAPGGGHRLRRVRQLRRGPAGLPVHRHPGHHRHRHPVAHRRGVQPVQPRLQPLRHRRCRAGLHVLPDPADGPGHPARLRGPAARLAGGGRERGRPHLALLAVRRRPGADAGRPRLHAAAVRQRVLRLRHGGGADQRDHPADRDPDRVVPERERAGRPAERGQGTRPGHGGDHRACSWWATPCCSGGRPDGCGDRDRPGRPGGARPGGGAAREDEAVPGLALGHPGAGRRLLPDPAVRGAALRRGVQLRPGGAPGRLLRRADPVAEARGDHHRADPRC